MKGLLIIVGIFCTVCVYAQDKVIINQHVTLDNVTVEQTGQEVAVEFDVRAHGNEFRRNEAVLLTPQIGGVALPDIAVSGVRRARVWKRSQALAGRDALPEPSLPMTVRPGRTAVSHYRRVVPFVPTMESGELTVSSVIARCCSQTEPVVSKITRELELLPVIQQQGKKLSASEIASLVSWLEPVEEVVKRRETSFTANVTYPQGGTDVRWDYENNGLELSRIDHMLRPLTSNESYNITDVRIDGYASVEGQWDTNERLARARAESFRMWFLSRYPSLRNVSVVAHGEDWEGLLKMVKADANMPLQWAVADIIEHVGIFNGREKQLMDLGQGVPYRYMYRYFFPHLRRMEVTLGYDIEHLDGRRAQEAMTSRPGDLSHAEMLRALREQRTDELTMYRRLAGQFPSDPVAIINASSAEMVAGNLAEAKAWLDKVKDDPRAATNITVHTMLSKVE